MAGKPVLRRQNTFSLPSSSSRSSNRPVSAEFTTPQHTRRRGGHEPPTPPRRRRDYSAERRSAAVRQRPVSDLTSNSSPASAGDNIPARRAGATHTHSACFHSKDRDDGVSNNNRRTNTANNRNSRRV